MSNQDFYKERAEKKKKNRQKELTLRLAFLLIIIAIVMVVILIVALVNHRNKNRLPNTETQVVEKYNDVEPTLDVELLTVNEYSRPGIALDRVNGIVVHWTANPGTTAIQNRDYFEGLATSGATHASSHFVIGLEGEIVQCIPCNEMCYASNDRNSDTIAIECCIPDESGKFTGNTYQSLVQLVTWLMGRYDLTTDDVIRHYDITGKDCPKYFVDNPEAWEQFKQDCNDYIEENGVERTETTEEQ